MTGIATIILAAGESRRMGSPKQLLRWGGTTLLRRAADAALEAALGPVLVVLGAGAEEVAEELSFCPVQTLINRDWALGMQTSIRYGIDGVERLYPNARAALLMACDQPHVTPRTLREIARAYRSQGGPCVAASYAGTLGIPALFRRELFPDLKDLDGGAKPLIEALGTSVITYPFPAGAVDLDTQSEYLEQTALAAV